MAKMKDCSNSVVTLIRRAVRVKKVPRTDSELRTTRALRNIPSSVPTRTYSMYRVGYVLNDSEPYVAVGGSIAV